MATCLSTANNGTADAGNTAPGRLHVAMAAWRMAWMGDILASKVSNVLVASVLSWMQPVSLTGSAMASKTNAKIRLRKPGGFRLCRQNTVFSAD